MSVTKMDFSLIVISEKSMFLTFLYALQANDSWVIMIRNRYCILNIILKILKEKQRNKYSHNYIKKVIKARMQSFGRFAKQ